MSIFIQICVISRADELGLLLRILEVTLASSIEAKQNPTASGIILHRAASYDLLLFLLTLGRENSLRRKILSLAQLMPGEHVLDIGCGTGTTAIEAKSIVGPSGTVTGIDASQEMIRRARKKAVRSKCEVDFTQAFVEAAPFSYAQFDLVVSTLMLHHLPRHIRRQCAAEIRRVLKPNGRVLAVDFTTSPGTKGIVAHLHRHGHISFDELVSMFRDAGMNIVESGAVGISDLHFVLASVPA